MLKKVVGVGFMAVLAFILSLTVYAEPEPDLIFEEETGHLTISKCI